jgi:hypothetical protein
VLLNQPYEWKITCTTTLPHLNLALREEDRQFFLSTLYGRLPWRFLGSGVRCKINFVRAVNPSFLPSILPSDFRLWPAGVETLGPRWKILHHF